MQQSEFREAVRLLHSGSLPPGRSISDVSQFIESTPLQTLLNVLRSNRNDCSDSELHTAMSVVVRQTRSGALTVHTCPLDDLVNLTSSVMSISIRDDVPKYVQLKSYDLLAMLFASLPSSIFRGDSQRAQLVECMVSSRFVACLGQALLSFGGRQPNEDWRRGGLCDVLSSCSVYVAAGLREVGDELAVGSDLSTAKAIEFFESLQGYVEAGTRSDWVFACGLTDSCVRTLMRLVAAEEARLSGNTVSGASDFSSVLSTGIDCLLSLCRRMDHVSKSASRIECLTDWDLGFLRDRESVISVPKKTLLGNMNSTLCSLHVPNIATREEACRCFSGIIGALAKVSTLEVSSTLNAAASNFDSGLGSGSLDDTSEVDGDSLPTIVAAGSLFSGLVELKPGFLAPCKLATAQLICSAAQYVTSLAGCVLSLGAKPRKGYPSWVLADVVSVASGALALVIAFGKGLVGCVDAKSPLDVVDALLRSVLESSFFALVLTRGKYLAGTYAAPILESVEHVGELRSKCIESLVEVIYVTKDFPEKVCAALLQESLVATNPRVFLNLLGAVISASDVDLRPPCSQVMAIILRDNEASSLNSSSSVQEGANLRPLALSKEVLDFIGKVSEGSLEIMDLLRLADWLLVLISKCDVEARPYVGSVHMGDLHKTLVAVCETISGRCSSTSSSSPTFTPEEGAALNVLAGRCQARLQEAVEKIDVNALLAGRLEDAAVDRNGPLGNGPLGASAAGHSVSVSGKTCDRVILRLNSVARAAELCFLTCRKDSAEYTEKLPSLIMSLIEAYLSGSCQTNTLSLPRTSHSSGGLASAVGCSQLLLVLMRYYSADLTHVVCRMWEVAALRMGADCVSGSAQVAVDLAVSSKYQKYISLESLRSEALSNAASVSGPAMSKVELEKYAAQQTRAAQAVSRHPSQIGLSTSTPSRGFDVDTCCKAGSKTVADFLSLCQLTEAAIHSLLGAGDKHAHHQDSSPDTLVAKASNLATISLSCSFASMRPSLTQMVLKHCVIPLGRHCTSPKLVEGFMQSHFSRLVEIVGRFAPLSRCASDDCADFDRLVDARNRKAESSQELDRKFLESLSVTVWQNAYSLLVAELSESFFQVVHHAYDVSDVSDDGSSSARGSIRSDSQSPRSSLRPTRHVKANRYQALAEGGDSLPRHGSASGSRSGERGSGSGPSSVRIPSRWLLSHLQELFSLSIFLVQSSPTSSCVRKVLVGSKHSLLPAFEPSAQTYAGSFAVDPASLQALAEFTVNLTRLALQVEAANPTDSFFRRVQRPRLGMCSDFLDLLTGLLHSVLGVLVKQQCESAFVSLATSLFALNTESGHSLKGVADMLRPLPQEAKSQSGSGSGSGGQNNVGSLGAFKTLVVNQLVRV